MIKMKRARIPPNLGECIAILGDPQTWRGHCHEVSNNLVVALGIGHSAAVRYGLYLGPVHAQSMFHGHSVVRHGWIEVRRTRKIIDITRWVFENAQPYVFYGDNAGLYDYPVALLSPMK